LQSQRSLAPTLHHDITLGGKGDRICDIVCCGRQRSS